MKKILLCTSLLTGTVVLCTSLNNVDGGKGVDAIIGSWELVGNYDIDSVFNNDSLIEVNRRDTSYLHGKSIIITFKSDNTSVITDSRANPDNLMGLPRTGASTYALLQGKIVLPDWGDFSDTFNYAIVKNALSINQSGWPGHQGTIAPYNHIAKLQRTHIFQRR